MTLEDQPNAPVDLSDLENDASEPETDSGEESSEDESGFLFLSDEDEVSEEMVAHFIAEQEHDDLVQESLELDRQNEVLDVVIEAVKRERDEARQALKRKMQEREEFTRFKRLRNAIRDAYDAMGVAAPLIEGQSATGSGQAPPEATVTAVTDFEAATAEARRCLDDLRLLQSQMDED